MSLSQLPNPKGLGDLWPSPSGIMRRVISPSVLGQVSRFLPSRVFRGRLGPSHLHEGPEQPGGLELGHIGFYCRFPLRVETR